jgi:2-C-methyl-D-erythritol 4-phosphate cytidylyltransferase
VADKNKIAAIIPAAGLGRRFVAGENKPLYELLGKPLVVWALQAVQAVVEISEIVLVVKEDDLKVAADLVERYSITKTRRIVPGGAERQDSVYKGLGTLDKDTSIVVIHDGARPLVDSLLIKKSIMALEGVDGVVAAVPVKDTIKEVKGKGPASSGAKGPSNSGREDGLIVQSTLNRNVLWAIQTPQTFHYAKIMEAHRKAHKEGFYATDDAALVERYGGIVGIVQGSYMNLKITTLEDINIAETLYLKINRDTSCLKVKGGT